MPLRDKTEFSYLFTSWFFFISILYFRFFLITESAPISQVQFSPEMYLCWTRKKVLPYNFGFVNKCFVKNDVAFSSFSEICFEISNFEFTPRFWSRFVTCNCVFIEAIFEQAPLSQNCDFIIVNSYWNQSIFIKNLKF